MDNSQRKPRNLKELLAQMTPEERLRLDLELSSRRHFTITEDTRRRVSALLAAFKASQSLELGDIYPAQERVPAVDVSHLVLRLGFRVVSSTADFVADFARTVDAFVKSREFALAHLGAGVEVLHGTQRYNGQAHDLALWPPSTPGGMGRLVGRIEVSDAALVNALSRGVTARIGLRAAAEEAPLLIATCDLPSSKGDSVTIDLDCEVPVTGRSTPLVDIESCIRIEIADNKWAIDLLVRILEVKILGIVSKKYPFHRAEEVTQETFLRLCLAVDRPPWANIVHKIRHAAREVTPGEWKLPDELYEQCLHFLLRIAKDRGIDELRRERARPFEPLDEVGSHGEPADSGNEDPSVTIPRSEMETKRTIAVRDCVNQLKDSDREIIRLRWPYLFDTDGPPQSNPGGPEVFDRPSFAEIVARNREARPPRQGSLSADKYREREEGRLRTQHRRALVRIQECLQKKGITDLRN